MGNLCSRKAHVCQLSSLFLLFQHRGQRALLDPVRLLPLVEHSDPRRDILLRLPPAVFDAGFQCVDFFLAALDVGDAVLPFRFDAAQTTEYRIQLLFGRLAGGSKGSDGV